MNIYAIETGYFKLDGGAVFGVVPKSLWNTVYPADENNLCNFSMRCLLIETRDRLILIDAGIGTKQSEKFFSYYYLNGDASLKTSLNEKGFSVSDITDVLLTHLHFDHCGGAIEPDENGSLVPAFPNAVYRVSSFQWNWAMSPNQRERSSFLPENYILLKETGKLKFIENESELVKNLSVRFFNGHTGGLIVPYIRYNSRIMVYVSDLLPTAAHIPVSWICGFDTSPLISMQEKENFLKEAAENKYILIFEHDSYCECCTLKQTERGIRVNECFTLEEFFRVSNTQQVSCSEAS
jgi:glyoxylase-like metal-dependent hydrolase (beta-lactamase superfamily II)